MIAPLWCIRLRLVQSLEEFETFDREYLDVRDAGIALLPEKAIQRRAPRVVNRNSQIDQPVDVPHPRQGSFRCIPVRHSLFSFNHCLILNCHFFPINTIAFSVARNHCPFFPLGQHSGVLL
jgi:hypothetical protein